MAWKIHLKGEFIGGGANALDSIDGSTLAENDIALVFTTTKEVHAYRLDSSSGLAENSPYVIAPDVSAGTKRWIRGAAAVTGVDTVGSASADDNWVTVGASGNYATVNAAFAAGHQNVILLEDQALSDDLIVRDPSKGFGVKGIRAGTGEAGLVKLDPNGHNIFFEHDIGPYTGWQCSVVQGNATVTVTDGAFAGFIANNMPIGSKYLAYFRFMNVGGYGKNISPITIASDTTFTLDVGVPDATAAGTQYIEFTNSRGQIVCSASAGGTVVTIDNTSWNYSQHDPTNAHFMPPLASAIEVDGDFYQIVEHISQWQFVVDRPLHRAVTTAEYVFIAWNIPMVIESVELIVDSSDFFILGYGCGVYRPQWRDVRITPASGSEAVTAICWHDDGVGGFYERVVVSDSFTSNFNLRIARDASLSNCSLPIDCIPEGSGYIRGCRFWDTGSTTFDFYDVFPNSLEVGPKFDNNYIETTADTFKFTLSKGSSVYYDDYGVGNINTNGNPVACVDQAATAAAASGTIQINGHQTFFANMTGSCTFNMPVVPQKGCRMLIRDVAGNFATYNQTVTAYLANIDGAGSATLNVNNQVAEYVFDGTNWWSI